MWLSSAIKAVAASAATQEIARTVQQAAIGTQDVTENITGVSQAANVTGEAASDLLAASGNLARQAASLALALGIVFLIEGVVACVVALGNRRVRGWGWGLTNGIVTLILGLLIVTMQAGGLLTVLGILVGISFLFSGVDLLVFSAAFHEPEG